MPKQVVIPSHIEKFTGAGEGCLSTFFAQLDAYFALQESPNNVKLGVSIQLLGGAANEWWAAVFSKLPSEEQSYQRLKDDLAKRFRTGDESLTARRKQLTLRVTRSSPPNFLDSVNSFNSEFTRNQQHITNQSESDTLFAYCECIRQSIPHYPEVMQLQQTIESAMVTVDMSWITLQQSVTVRASTVVDMSHPTPSHSSLSSSSTGPPRRTIGVRRPRPTDNTMSYAEARRLNICTFCRNPSASHRSVRALNPATQKYDGEILCPLLRDKIKSGEVPEQQPSSSYSSGHSFPTQHLNSSDSRSPATNPAVKKQY